MMMQTLIWLPTEAFIPHYTACPSGTSFLTHWGQDKMAATLADDTFKRKFVNENILISIKISLKFVSKGPINNIPALV